MASLNKVFLMGNLTRDPEIRHTPKGTAVGDLSMAINRSYTAPDGSTKDEVCYVDVVVWGRQAETCKDYLTKGSPIFIEGRLQLDQWETQQGEKRSRLRIHAERTQFIGGRGGGYSRSASSPERGERRESNSGGSRDYERPARENYDEPPVNDSGADDEIPF